MKFLELPWQELFVNKFFGNDLNYVAVAITFYDVAVERVMLDPVFTHKHQCVATNHQVLDSLVNSDTITRGSDRVHHHTLHLSKAQVKFRPDLSRQFSAELVVTNLQLKERSLRRQQCQHQFRCQRYYCLTTYTLPRLAQSFMRRPQLITLDEIRQGQFRTLNSNIKKMIAATG